MGCNIHLKVLTKYRMEGKDKELEGQTPYSDYNFLDGTYTNRDYRMYAKMANVRNYDWYKEGEYFEPRGVFPYASEWNMRELLMYPVDTKNISEDNLVDELYDCSKEKVCTKERADEWLKKGYSKKVGNHHITDPDYHSYSWLTTAEYEKCLNEVTAEVDKSTEPYKSYPDPGWYALLAAMKELEKKYDTVIVFAFDN